MGTPLSEIGSYTLLDINVAGAAAIAFLNPLMAQFDLLITGPFGLGSLQFDISAQFQAALSVQVNIGLQISNPIAGFQATLAALAALTASLNAAISLGLPSLSVELGATLSATTALTGALSLRLAGIVALLKAAIAVKLPALNFLADLTAALTAGPIVLLSFGFDSSGNFVPEQLSSVGTETSALFSTGLTGVLPTDDVAGIMLVTSASASASAISTLFKVV